jgi:transcriptional regulator with XRE-family HTH domain
MYMKGSYQYRKRDYGFGNLCLTLRTAIGVTQGELAHLLGVTERTIQTWEGGSSYPKIDRLKHFIELCVQHQAFAAGHEEEEIRALWQAARQRVLLDESWLTRLLGASLPDVISVPTGQSTATDAASLPTALPTSQVGALPRIDWVGALDVGSFRGREVELADLSRWILQEQCRFVAILGMGGIGKSALVSLLGHQLARHFEIVLWRSVRDAPSCEELVADCITFCSETPPAEFPASLEQRLNQLLARLQAHRCLLVLDNLETLLQSGDRAGNYLPGYESYGRLIGRLAESAHQSCVLLTSREKPKEIEPLEGVRSPVRSLRLVGVDEHAAHDLLSDKELRGTPAAWGRLIASYAGNPLALKIVAQAISDLFGAISTGSCEKGNWSSMASARCCTSRWGVSLRWNTCCLPGSPCCASGSRWTP